MNNPKIRNFLLLMLLAACWGPSFLFIKIGTEYFEPISFTFFRIGIAAILLNVVLLVKKMEVWKYRNLFHHFLFLGIIGSSLPFTLFNFAQKSVSSSLAATINGMVPLITIIIAHFSTSDDRLTKNKLLGAVIGFIGLGVLVMPKLFGVKSTLFGIIALIIAVSCYSTAFVYSRRYVKGINPVIASTIQLSFATLILLIVSVIFENPWKIIDVPTKPLISLISLSVFGTAIAFLLLYKIMELTSASYVSMVNYIVPVIGVVLGVVVLKESLSLTSLIGCVVIILGVMVANGVFGRMKNLK